MKNNNINIKNTIKHLLIAIFLLLNIIYIYSWQNKTITYQNYNHPNIQTSYVQARIRGQSMEKTFLEHHTYDLEIYKYKNINEIKRGDIIAFNRENRQVIKRVLAIPNDIIEVRKINNQKKVYLNNKYLEEPYLNDPNLQIGKMGLTRKIIVEPNCVFVAGDNRDFSTDSFFYYEPNIHFEDIYFTVITATETSFKTW